MSDPVSAAVIGAGDRGRQYARYALLHPDRLRVTAVVEPRERWRDHLAQDHGLGSHQVFAHLDELLKARPDVDALIVATPDQDHVPTTQRLLDAGYRNILLEKPAATTMRDLDELMSSVEAADAHIQICHVLRYTKFFSTVRAVARSGTLGTILSVTHHENISQQHFAHSYVRGKWARSDESSVFLLAKTCHDFDILSWILEDEFEVVSSVGETGLFTKDLAPDGAPLRCMDGCRIESTCPFYAPRIYVNDDTTWPATAIDIAPNPEIRASVVASGPYGRCVYHCDNDAPDHQSVLARTRQGVAVAMIVHGLAPEENREIELVGTKGTLRGHFAGPDSWCRVTTTDGNEFDADVTSRGDDAGHSHGGGDFGLMTDFVEHIASGDWTGASNLATAIHSCVAALAAESARRSGSSIRIDAYLDEQRQRLTDR